LAFPRLPLEALGDPSSPDSSLAVEEGRRIVACSAAAGSAGIRRGMGVAAARTRVPQLRVRLRQPSQETDALARLACWAGRFTPRLSLAPPDALLLEVGGCLRLFGGLPAILDRLAGELAAQGFSATHAVAATPQAALWFAMQMPGVRCDTPAATRQALDHLPSEVLPAEIARTLHRFGLRRLGAARCLPRAALAQRIGREAIQTLARAYGELPDLRTDFAFPARFAQSLELPSAVENAGALLFAARRLTAALAGWLAVRKAGIAACCLHLRHRQGSTPLTLAFAGATRDPPRFERVLRERLQRHVLAAPVEALRLEAGTVADLAEENGTLFAQPGDSRHAMAALLERLRARLGEARVFTLAMAPDHRPECATRRGAAGTADVTPPVRRPFWLLAIPRRLDEIGGRPHDRGALRLLSGPERIESGWWDDGEAAGDLRRDYFIALTPDQRWLWIFREARLAGDWYLHGFFA